jgi:malate synthase
MPAAPAIRGPRVDGADEILTGDALAFVGELERRFRDGRREILDARRLRRAAFGAGEPPRFLDETREIRESDWAVAPPPHALADRRVEITGPVDPKMVINALNSGARCFMADFEDATTPTWANVIGGQRAVRDAARGTLTHTDERGREYRLGERTATLLVRPRGWHLPERHLELDGAPLAGALVDAGLFLFHGARPLLRRGAGPFLYLPKLEHHREARLWDRVLACAEDLLGLPAGCVRATVLIETLPAAFQMDEILWELRGRSTGLNAGRWDYIASVIRTLGARSEYVLPDRGDVTMTVPFMRAYTDLLVATCHRRGAHAMGGMSAFVPSRRNEQVNRRAIDAVRADKEREAGAGFDGTWVAHPDLVPVATAVFDAALGDAPNQVGRRRDDVAVDAAALLDVAATPGRATRSGLAGDVSVGLRYLTAWLAGSGAVAIDDLMEDAATAEIARSQVWQWVRHRTPLDGGTLVDAALVEDVLAAEVERLRGDAAYGSGRLDDAAALFRAVALADDPPEYLTLPAYELVA